MSLHNPIVPVKQFPVGIISAKNLDDPDFLSKITEGYIQQINHIYTNNANKLVYDFAFEHGIPLTVFPITGDRNLLWSIARIVENSKFVYIVATPDSKSAQHAKESCDQKSIKYRVYDFEPCNHWKEKVFKIAEIVAASTSEDKEKSEFLRAVDKII